MSVDISPIFVYCSQAQTFVHTLDFAGREGGFLLGNVNTRGTDRFRSNGYEGSKEVIGDPRRRW